MIEKVNPSHPDKVADRIAGAIVDLAYKKQENPKIAAEVLIGHGYGHVVIETSVDMEKEDVAFIVDRFAPGIRVFIQIVPQDVHLAENQSKEIRCGDNGIFKGMPLTEEQKELSKIAREIYTSYPYDGKYILDEARLIICDVSVNIYAFLKAQKTGKPVEICCAIGDDTIDGIPYQDIVNIAKDYIDSVGGFEKFAEWGLF